jgi:hypothetical protein
MTDSRSDHLHDDELVYDDDWEPEPDEEDALPKRPRRRLVTPISAALTGALVGALGFIGGVEVQKGQDDGATGSGAQAAAAASGAGGGARGGFAPSGAGGGARGGVAPSGAGGPQGAGGPGGAQSNATVGSVANKKGGTLYVKDSDGNTIRVKTTSHSKISRTASTTSGAIHPGDTVIVQGSKSSSGTITATQIQATSSSATSGLAGLFGGGGLGGGGGQGQASGPQQAAPDGG